MNDETTQRDLSDDLERTLASVLDEIIPPSTDGRLPGAAEIGLARYIEQAVPKMPELWLMIVQGLAELDDLAATRHGRRFAELSRPERVALLNEQSFVLALSLHAYVGYYQHPRVVEALGLDPRPPHPKGYQMEPNNLTLLDAVRRRPKLYREC